MPEHPFWYTGDLDPEIQQTVTVDGVAEDLSGADTVLFKLREIGSSTVALTGTASFVDDGTDGAITYQWQSGDTDNAGVYLAWWEIITSGETQAVGEAVIEFRDHAPINGAYIELEEFKTTIELASSFADQDIQRVLVAASQAIENYTGRVFALDADATTVRYYDVFDPCVVMIDDATTIATVELDDTGNGVHDTTWTAGTMFYPEPYNAALDGYPYDQLRATNGYRFPTYARRSVKITGRFGWPTVPGPVVDATSITASRLLKRRREAPFGIVTSALDASQAMRIPRIDPDVAALLNPYRRTRLVA